MAANIPKARDSSVPEGSLTATPPSFQGWRTPLKPRAVKVGKGTSHWEDLELPLGADTTSDLPSLSLRQA